MPTSRSPASSPSSPATPAAALWRGDDRARGAGRSLPAVLGAGTSPFPTLGLVPGLHARVPMADLLALAAPGTALHALLLRYAQAYAVVAGQSLACNRLHTIEARCARWILRTHDRVRADTFTLTHEVLGQMLVVRRPSVTVALETMQRAGCIAYHRG